MARVFIPTQLLELTGGALEVETGGSMVREVVDELENRFPGIKARLCSGDQLSPQLQVSVDDAISSRGLSAPVGGNSEVHFLPAIGGG